MKKSNGKKIVIIIGIVAVVIVLAIISYIVFNKYINKPIAEDNKNNNQIEENIVEDNIYGTEGRYYIGEKDDYIWLINSDLVAKRIYKKSHYYDSQYIVRDNMLFIIYGNTAYVDVVDIESGKTYKVTNQDIAENNGNGLGIIYYKKNQKIYRKDFKTDIETEDNSEKTYGNYYYFYDEEAGSLKMKEATAEDDEIIYHYNNPSHIEFIIGENNVYHLGDNSLFVFGKASKKNTIIQNGNFSSLQVVEYNASTFAYSDISAVYLVGEDLSKQEILRSDEEGHISSISKISDNVMQIGVEHLVANGGVYWDTDKYYRYDFSTNKLEETDTYYYGLKPIDISADRIKELEEVQTTPYKFDVNEIENSKSTTSKRILQELNENINEQDVLNKIGLSANDFNKYKDQFVGKNSDNVFSKTQEMQEKYSKIAKRNIIVLENYILKSDDKLTESLISMVNSNGQNKYNKLYACILSGIIKYYIEDDIQKIELVKARAIPAGGYEIELTINDNYVLAYNYGEEKTDNYGVLAYKDVSSMDEVNNNYDKYENGENTFLDLNVMSYDYAGYIDNLFDN